MYGFIYDPVAEYERQRDLECEANYFGFNSVGEYLDAKENWKDEDADRMLDDMRADLCA